MIRSLLSFVFMWVWFVFFFFSCFCLFLVFQDMSSCVFVGKNKTARKNSWTEVVWTTAFNVDFVIHILVSFIEEDRRLSHDRIALLLLHNPCNQDCRASWTCIAKPFNCNKSITFYLYSTVYSILHTVINCRCLSPSQKLISGRKFILPAETKTDSKGGSQF